MSRVFVGTDNVEVLSVRRVSVRAVRATGFRRRVVEALTTSTRSAEPT